MSIVAIKQLLEAGVHFGHQTRRWNPKMKNFVFQVRNGIHIIDLQKTIKQIKGAYEFVSESVANGGKVLFVGTKKQASGAVEKEAERCGMYYVSTRWLGGLLTNFSTVSKSLHRLKLLESLTAENEEVVKEDDDLSNKKKYTKKEMLKFEKEKQKLLKFFGGIRDMTKPPEVLFVIDSKKEEIAVKEAKKLKIQVVAVVDTNCDPTIIDHPIPGNDDAIRAIGLFAKIIADAVQNGKDQIKTVVDDEDGDGEGRYVGNISDIEKAMLEKSEIDMEAESDEQDTAGSEKTVNVDKASN